MVRSRLCNYRDPYILVSGTINNGKGEDDAVKQLDKRNKGVIFKNGAPFINCTSEMNNTQIDHAKDLDVGTPMHNLIEYSNNCSKTSGSLCSIIEIKPTDTIENSESFESQIIITGKALADGDTKDIKIAVPLKCLSKFWRTLGMSLINCEVNLVLT